MDKCYSITLVFTKDGQKPEEKRFRRIIGRSPQGAITKAFRLSRVRKCLQNEHKTYGCEEISIKVRCLGSVDK